MHVDRDRSGTIRMQLRAHSMRLRSEEGQDCQAKQLLLACTCRFDVMDATRDSLSVLLQSDPQRLVLLRRRLGTAPHWSKSLSKFDITKPSVTLILLSDPLPAGIGVQT